MFNFASVRLYGTKRQTTLVLGVIALLVIASAGVGVYLYSSSNMSTAQSTGSTPALSTTISGNGTTHFKVNYDQLVVGYNSGLWSLSLMSTGGKPIKLLTAVLSTPVESKLCTGELGGFYFSNCPATSPASGAFPTNATFTGYGAGTGPGSAKVGNTYKVTLVEVFADGTKTNETLSVTAAAQG